jgi:hypothetical protein
MGIDDKMEDSNKPIKYFRIEFIMDNPYWKQANYYFVEPKMRDGEDVDKRRETRIYLERCDEILKSADYFVNVVMKGIFDVSE